jgi:protein-disulfide isomerase
MSDEHEEDRDSAPQRRTKKKKKKRRRSASVQGERPPRRRRSEAASAGDAQWTTNQLVLAAVAGLGIGALGGYYAAQDAPTAAADKDGTQPTAQQTAPTPPKRGAQKPQDPTARSYVKLAKWSPRIGPEHAKVTIVEFSDFQ